MTELATEYGLYGYRRITALLQREGGRVNHKRVQRLWRREGLKVPQRQPKRGRLWLTDGSCVRRRGATPAYLRSDNGAEFTARAVREWLGKLAVTTLYIAPGSPWENGYVESLIGKLRDELLNGEIFYTLK
jgi:transposase InsO family protein